MSRADENRRLAVVGGGLAGWAAVRAALAAGLPGTEILLLERGAGPFDAWRCPDFGDTPDELSAAAWQTHEGPLFDKAWLDVLGSLAVPPAPGGSVRSAAAEATRELAAAGVTVRGGAKAVEVVRDADGNFRVWFEQGVPVAARRLVLALGGGSNHGFGWAEEWGLPLAPRFPVGLNLRLGLARGRSWNELPEVPASITITGVKGLEGLTAAGRVSSRHPWMEGTAVSHLSMLVPAALAAAKYAGELRVDWLPGAEGGLSPKVFARFQEQAGRRALGEFPWEGIAPALWRFVLKAARLAPETPWRALSMRQGQMLGTQLRATRLPFKGFRLDREAGLSAGGISLAGLVPGTFEVRSTPGLFWVGEGVDLHALDAGANRALALAAGAAAGAVAASGE
jgi:predicted flavoprotein YhiN